MPKYPRVPRLKRSALVREFHNLRDDPDWNECRGKRPVRVRRLDDDSLLMTMYSKFFYSKHTSWKHNRKTQYRR